MKKLNKVNGVLVISGDDKCKKAKDTKATVAEKLDYIIDLLERLVK